MKKKELNQKIDDLLKLLDGDSTGRRVNEIRAKFGNDVMNRAKSMGLILYYYQEMQVERNFPHDSFYCRITPEGSKILNIDGGLVKLHRSKLINKIIVFTSLVFVIATFLVTVLK